MTDVAFNQATIEWNSSSWQESSPEVMCPAPSYYILTQKHILKFIYKIKKAISFLWVYCVLLL